MTAPNALCDTCDHRCCSACDGGDLWTRGELLVSPHSRAWKDGRPTERWYEVHRVTADQIAGCRVYVFVKTFATEQEARDFIAAREESQS